MIDILLLEDDPDYHMLIPPAFPKETKYHIVSTSDEFRSYIDIEEQVRLYLLDDAVPPTKEENAQREFIKNTLIYMRNSLMHVFSI